VISNLFRVGQSLNIYRSVYYTHYKYLPEVIILTKPFKNTNVFSYSKSIAFHLSQGHYLVHYRKALTNVYVCYKHSEQLYAVKSFNSLKLVKVWMSNISILKGKRNTFASLLQV